MENKFFNVASTILALLGIVAVFFWVVWLFVEPCIWWTPHSEVRLYVRAFLVLFAINTFASLRLYNSIVQNTRFSIKLRESVVKLQQLFPALDRSLRNLNSMMGNVKSSTESLKKAIDTNTDKVDSLSDKMKK